MSQEQASNCQQGFVVTNDFAFVPNCDIRMPDNKTVIACAPTVPPLDPPTVLLPCPTFEITVSATVTTVTPNPNYPQLTGGAVTNTNRDCITCENNIQVNLDLTMPKLMEYVNFRLDEAMTPDHSCVPATVIYDYAGAHAPGDTITVCADRSFPTDALYIPSGAYGIGFNTGDSENFQVSTYEKPALLVRAKLVSAYGLGVMACNANIAYVTDLHPVHVRDDNYFPYPPSAIIPVSNEMHLTGQPNYRVLLCFDRELLSRSDVKPYFIAIVYPPCGLGAGPTAPLEVP